MNRYYWPLMFSTLLADASANTPDILLANIFQQSTLTTYSVPKQTASRLPRWDSANEPPPLSMQAAIKVAETQLRKSYPTVSTWQPQRVVLTSSPRGEKEYVWYYEISLQEKTNDKKRREEGTIFVLMDGSVVNPTVVIRPNVAAEQDARKSGSRTPH